LIADFVKQFLQVLIVQHSICIYRWKNCLEEWSLEVSEPELPEILINGSW
jgi:hypothetical protein